MGSATTAQTRRVEIDDAAAGGRLDRALAELLPEISRTRLKALIVGGHVRIAGEKVAEPSRRVKLGEVFEIHVPGVVAPIPVGQDIPLTVLFEDAHVIVIDKPSGLVVHPAAGNPDHTLVNALIAHCGASLSGIGGVARPGIVHRLDKDTSGVMIAAKTDAAHASLTRQFAGHSLDRAYQAICWGAFKERDGTVEGAIGRSPRNRKKMAVVPRGGKEATTHYRVVRAVNPWASLVECRLETGRTHQIRVHLTHIGHPIVGDPLYGRADRRRFALVDEGFRTRVEALGRQALHACLIGFEHPESGDWLRFESDLPEDIKSLM